MKNELYITKIDKKLDLNNLKAHLKLFPDDIAYIGGSLIDGQINKYSEGLGNKYSDLDIFIIRESSKFLDSNSTYAGKFKKIDFLELPEYGIDIEIYDRQFIENLILSVNNIELASNQRVSNSFVIDDSFDYIDISTFFNRFRNSICIFNENEFGLLKNKLVLSKWLELQKYSIINLIENLYADILGNLDEKNYDVAVMCTRDAYLLLIKYIVFSLDDTVDRDKWLSVKLRNIVKYHPSYQELESLYDILFFGDLSNDDSKLKVCQDSIKFIKKTLESEEMEGLL
ncbi:hypothetical protein [Streptococcus sanguinis]|uniref:hypothetical protein n=2 Tax=Streptococcus sanguinis TaxID=1305 RepID=UPI001CC00B73|nr:hypothetical protein [Streptococcus sanguinis]MBZ2040306.1 hypothetical protein [Streptococcus sanguinis]